jgi:hypothetical protein
MTANARNSGHPTAGAGSAPVPPGQKRDCGAPTADPDHDSEHRGRKHREQLAKEDRLDRYRGGKHLDDLVRFLLDQLRQDHSPV